MWLLNHKKSLSDSGILNGLSDHHSHILPGVDDGINTLANALEALCHMERDGVENVWLTPHIMEDYPNTTARLRDGFDELSDAYAGRAGANPVHLHLAAEYMVDSLYAERLASRDLLTLDSEGHVLVETSYYRSPANLQEMLIMTSAAGYCPVLAHPERYIYMTDSDYARLHASGIKMQLNLGSVAGAYGPEPARRAKRLLKDGFYSMVGSDMHSLRNTRSCLSSPVPSKVAALIANLTRKQNQHI